MKKKLNRWTLIAIKHLQTLKKATPADKKRNLARLNESQLYEPYLFDKMPNRLPSFQNPKN